MSVSFHFNRFTCRFLLTEHPFIHHLSLHLRVHFKGETRAPRCASVPFSIFDRTLSQRRFAFQLVSRWLTFSHCPAKLRIPRIKNRTPLRVETNRRARNESEGETMVNGVIGARKPVFSPLSVTKCVINFNDLNDFLS